MDRYPPGQSQKEAAPVPAPAILLVEDSPVDAMLVRQMLGSAVAAFSVETASTLSSALRLATGSIDLILLDLNLPDSRGLGTLIRLRAAAPSTPIIVLSATEDRGTATDSLRHGASDFILKSLLTREVLLRAISRHLRRAAQA